MDVSGKVALVTGATMGIGRATAELLARRGARVAIAGRSREVLEQMAEAARAEGLEMFAAPADITDDASVRGMVERVVKHFGRLDLIVNNAGATGVCPLETTPLAAYRQLLEINLFGAVRVIQAAIPTMRAQGGGVILNVSSMTTRDRYAGIGAYASAKHALNGMSESLRLELAVDNIRILLAFPDHTATNLGPNAVMMIPLGRQVPGSAPHKPPVPPEFVAANILYAIQTEAEERYMEAVPA